MIPRPPGLIVAAPASGSGKTVVTLGLLRHFARAGRAVASAKAGPDYIDPAFHAAATGRACLNIDPWAMRGATIAGILERLGEAELILCEGVMGLFDGAIGGSGSTADIAAATGWPVVLVVDARAQGASVGALLRGFAGHRPDVTVAGVIFNRVAGESHARILAEASREAVPSTAILGAVQRSDSLNLPERHLGLVQAREKADLGDFLDRAADGISSQVDVQTLLTLARPAKVETARARSQPLPPPGQRIAVADDAAFAFRYPLVIDGWRAQGAEIVPFSPLADEAPDGLADAVYLPGGYPELHAGRLAAAARFKTGLRSAADRGAAVFGECGGYMVMGRGLVDGSGARHAMADLLPLETSFAARKLHLGYRRARVAVDCPLGRIGARFRGHEFHYAAILEEGPASSLFVCEDAAGRELGPTGLASGRVIGSFVHLIDREENG
jgi:cobyrinic acid a,c-diamide synthase